VQLLDCDRVSLPGTYVFYRLVLKWGLLSGNPSPACFQSYARRGLALDLSKYCYQQASVLAVGGHMCLARSVGQCNPTLICLRNPCMGRDATLLALISNKLAGIPLAADSFIR